MARQLTFDLGTREARGRDDFFVSEANAAAMAAIDGWQDWPAQKLLLTGPEGAGKSHLVQVWAALADAVVIGAEALANTDPAPLAGRNVALDDLDRVAGDDAAERAAFHLHNLVLAEGGSLLVTASAPANRWGLALPDLASRIQGTGTVALDLPDDALLAAVLVKLFGDRQIAAPPTLIDYLVPRIERSFAAAAHAVALLDAAALSEGRAVSRKLAGQVLDAQPDML